MNDYSILNKTIISSICFLEALLFCYSSIYLSSFLNRIKNRYLNSDTLNNAASGAILSLALTHLLPEGFKQSNNFFTISYNLDMTGFIILAPIVALVSIDFLTGHHCITNEQDISLNSHTPVPESHIDDYYGSNNTDFESAKTSIDDIEKNRGNRIISKMLPIILVLTSRFFYLLITLIGHSVLEGMMIGSKNGSVLWAMSFGIIAHKWAECFVIISALSDVKNFWIKNLCIMLFCLGVPIGVIIGHCLTVQSHLCEVVFGQLAAGFFIYLSFELLTGHEKNETRNGFIHWASYILGVVTMSVIMAVATIIENANN